ncbi:hypothetical protein ABBQ38_004177 [Trebouxia sp. C0009 RCD-2024]
MNYLESSHRQRWIFTDAQLLDIRKALRAKSIATIAKVKEDARGAESGPPDKTSGNKLKPIRLEEDSRLCKYYQGKMQQVCKALTFPDKVAAAALLFFKRFYLTFSSLDHDPKNIMLTCIYLACKIEEAYIGADQFCSLVRQDSQSVLRNELNVLHGLKFDLITHPPLRALDGFFQDLLSWKANAANADEALHRLDAAGMSKARGAAQAALDALMLTDAPLLYSPSLVALAALRAGFRKIEVPSGKYLEHATSAQQTAAAEQGDVAAPLEHEQVMAQLGELDKLGQEGAAPVDEAEVRKIDRKLKACHNLLLDPESDIYKQKAAAAQQQLKEDRDSKWQLKRAASQAAEAELLGVLPDTLSHKRKRSDGDV